MSATPPSVEDALEHLRQFVNDNRPRHWKVMQLDCAVAAKNLDRVEAALHCALAQATPSGGDSDADL